MAEPSETPADDNDEQTPESTETVEASGDRKDEAEAEPEPEPDPLEQAQAEAARLKDQLLRMAADFDNFRKRSRREVADAESKGREDLLKELLPVFDNLERATAHADGTSDVSALTDGIQMVQKQFLDVLGRLGIEQIQALGQPFDPALHEAIQQLETADVPPGSVFGQVQPGYKLGDRLVRPAMVVVAKAPPSND